MRTPGRPPLPFRVFALLPKVLRLTAFVSVVLGVLAVSSVHALADTVREGLLSLGREMMAYANPQVLGATRTLALNGADLRFATGHADDDVAHVLDWYETRCAGHDAGMAAQLADLARSHRGAFAHETDARSIAGLPRSFSTLRHGNAQAGFVACLDVGERALTGPEVLARVQRFVDTGDLSAVGHMRYLYAQRDGHGTHLLAFWSDGPLNVKTMFPTTGDVPGNDPPGVPRLAGMRRVLSASEAGQPFGMQVYGGPNPIAQVDAHYTTQLEHAGWRPIPLRHEPAGLHGQRFHGFERDNTSAILVVGTDGAITQATLLFAQ